ncbi:MAG: DUF5662 family protein [Traorella sp.]
MNKFWGHLTTITKHKILVGKLCFRCGLYKQGLLHDMSKYSWVEFSSGVKYFQGNRSPIEKEKETIGYSKGWLHHKGRNKHHWEYWIDCSEWGIFGTKIPMEYMIEMFCDRVAASMIYKKEKYTDASALEYFMLNQHNYCMHEESKALLRDLLERCAHDGLDKTITYIRKECLENL